MARKEPIKEGRAEPADVLEARWARCEAHAHGVACLGRCVGSGGRGHSWNAPALGSMSGGVDALLQVLCLIGHMGVASPTPPLVRLISMERGLESTVHASQSIYPLNALSRKRLTERRHPRHDPEERAARRRPLARAGARSTTPLRAPVPGNSTRRSAICQAEEMASGHSRAPGNPAAGVWAWRRQHCGEWPLPTSRTATRRCADQSGQG